MAKTMTDFEAEIGARVGQLKTAFIELYDSIGADPPEAAGSRANAAG